MTDSRSRGLKEPTRKIFSIAYNFGLIYVVTLTLNKSDKV